jgi:hypothetical protein
VTPEISVAVNGTLWSFCGSSAPVISAKASMAINAMQGIGMQQVRIGTPVVDF